MKLILKTLATIGLILVSCPAYTYSDFDFALSFLGKGACKSIITSTVLAANPIKIVDSDNYIMFCSRRGNMAKCSFNDEKSKEFASRDLQIILDSPPNLAISTESGADLYVINTTRNAVAGNTKIIYSEDENKGTILGSKVCQGLFVTKQQFDHLKSENK